MKKVKFRISGMNCKSCAALIEEKLKNKKGIIRAKASFDSQKAVVVYDENQINELEIANAIKEVGDYQLEKINEDEDEEKPQPENISGIPESKKETEARPSANILSSIKVLRTLVIVSLALSVFSVFTSLKQLPQAKGNANTAAIAQNLPSANQQVPADANTFQITASDHIKGNINAPVTLVEFSDFQCPFCEKHEPTLQKILSDYPDKVRLVYKHFPLSFHQYSQKAAEASECASEQGKFWEYHDKLFENQSDFSIQNFKNWAQILGLNTAQFNSCLDSGKYEKKVQDDYKEGENKGVNGTPATFVNGQLVSGALPYDNFKQIIDKL